MRKTRLLSLLVLLMTAATGAWADVWTDIIINGDLEGADRQCFFVKENGLGNENVYYARIKDGIGVDGSRAIEVQSTGTETYSWDTQFFVRLPYELPAGTSYKVSFDYKADKTGDCDLQVQNEPGEYIWYTIGVPNSKITFGNGWTTFISGDITVPEQCNGLQNADGPHLNNFQTISFNLGKNGEATKYIIDNIKVEIPSEVLSGLTKKPLTKEMPQYPVEITSMAIMGDFLGQGEVNNWNPTNGWALTQDNSNPAIWKLTREFTAVARTYEYKIFANGNMDDFTLPVPADDKGQFVISEAGDYILTVTVDTEAGTASVRAAVPGSYTVKMKEGAVDAENWTITPTEATTTGVKEGTEVTLQYNGRLKVKGVTAVSDEKPADNTYLKWDANQKKLVATEIPAEVKTAADANQDVLWEAGTYVVEGNVTISGQITLDGNVDLIIKDGAKLTVTNQIASDDKNLSIYGQASQTGQLVVNSSDADAINNITTLEVHSAKVTASSSNNACGGFYNIGTFNVYGGSVDAEGTGGEGYGIGLLDNGSMNIYGGEVRAEGNGNGNSYSYGIRSGFSGATVTVYGGTLWAGCADKAALRNTITLTKGDGFSGKIEYSSDNSTWSETADADAKYVRVGY